MKKFKNVLWGIVLIALGVLIALNALNITDINLFFDGWWTLFIIVPCAIGSFTEREKVGNIIGLLVGVFLLLCAQNVLDFNILWKLLLPTVIIIIGLKLIFDGFFNNKAEKIIEELNQNGKPQKVSCATFSGQNLSFDGEKFEGAELTAVFGGIKCDLRNAVIEKDCAIKVSATFGGITILVPHNINVKVNSTSLFGGIDNKTYPINSNVTLYISGTCLFGGVDIK